jgi:type II restriction enzyme
MKKRKKIRVKKKTLVGKRNNGRKKLIKTFEDLVTPHEAIRTGFLKIALEKNKKATPFIEQAKHLKIEASKANTAKDLLSIKTIELPLLSASGLSDKAKSHLTEKDCQKIIERFIEEFLVPAGVSFIDELVYRFLLTKGDALGGIMRNYAGAMGQQTFVKAMIAIMALRNISFKYFDGASGKWLDGTYNDNSIIENCKGLFWKKNSEFRTMIFNITPSFIGKNVDMCVFNYEYSEYNVKKKEDFSSYLALGELKGGIDPAGADEHWKTANTALDRIRDAFTKRKKSPFTFFMGGAIAKDMANEIFNQLKSKELSAAANITNDEQLNEICNWILGI